MKNNKVLILESGENKAAFCTMVCLAREAGCEVLGIIVGKPCPSDAGVIYTDDPVQIMKAIRFFDPGVVFLEHDLGLGPHLTGRYFIRQLGLPSEILIGVSIYDQGYCDRMMHEKTRLEQNILSAGKFLKLLPV